MEHQGGQARTTRPVAVITGGSQGLGLALAEALARDGWALVIDARRGDRLDAAVARLAGHTDVVGVRGDVTDPAHRSALARAARELGPVRLLVNNASTLGASDGLLAATVAAHLASLALAWFALRLRGASPSLMI